MPDLVAEVIAAIVEALRDGAALEAERGRDDVASLIRATADRIEHG